MIRLGLSHADRRKYHQGLMESHPMRTTVEILNRNEEVMSRLTDDLFLTEGSVYIDGEADVKRSASITLIDPKQRLYFDPSAPTRNALFMDRFLKITREDYIAALDTDEIGLGSGWIECPVFHGPITRIDQDGYTIHVEAIGKESLYLDPALQWRSRTFRAGQPVTKAIRTLLEDRGEERIRMPKLPDEEIRKDFSVLGHEQGWRNIKRLARQIGYQAFYDGDGYFRLREVPHNPSHAFKYGKDVLVRPTIPYDFTTIRNLVQMVGPKPEHGGERLVVTARVPPRSGVSPARLGRNETDRFLVQREEVEHTKKPDKVARRAKRELADLSRLELAVEFEALPTPDLEERDLARLVTDLDEFQFRIATLSIPLMPTETMSVGFNKRPRVKGRRRARR